jgi:DNA-binding GntR family transcriptional regulator
MSDPKHKTPLSEKAYQQIRNRIISLELKPGMQVNNDALEHELSIGRTPVREALLRLTTEGLLTSVQGRGFFVRQVSLEDVKALFEAVMILERPGVSLAVRRIQSQDIVRLSKINAELESSMAQREFLQVTLRNSRFHRIVHEAVTNEFLTSSLRNLDSQYQRLAYLCFSREAHASDLKQHFAKVIADHTELIECFKKRDEAAAVEVITRHVYLFHSRVSQYLYPPVPKFEGVHEPLVMEA